MAKFIFSMSFCLILVLSNPVNASQEIWKSMTECAAVNHIMSINATNRGRNDGTPEKLMAAGDAQLEHASIHAKKDGIEEYSEAVKALYDNKLNEWGGKIIDANTMALMKNMPEMIDWAKYCGKMGNEYGVYDEVKKKYK